jgi:CoA:oxalate CoA-transferase
MMRVLEREWLEGDLRFLSNAGRVTNFAALKAEIESALAVRTTREWLALLEAEKIPCAPINNVAEMMADPQIAARNMIVTAHDPEAGTIRMQGNPIKLSGFADPTTRTPAPDLDADREAILKELG